MTTHGKLGLIILLVALLAITTDGFANSLPISDSNEWTLKYEMDVNPNTQNLDGNGVVDWLQNGTQTFSGGVLTSPYDLAGYPLLRSSTIEAEGVWSEPTNNIDYLHGWTVEVSMKVTMADADPASCAIMAAPVGGTDRAWLYVSPTDTCWVSGATLPYTVTSLKTDSNADDFHVFRIAQEPNSNTLSLWRDTELLSDTLTWAHAYSLKVLFIGDVTGNDGSEYQINYVRLRSGAYAPIPEPTTLVLLVCGALMALVRRRVR